MAEIKFGIVFPGFAAGAPDGKELLRVARRVEELGYDGIWGADKVVTAQPRLEPLSLLGALAWATEKVTIGTAVLLLPLRHPTIVAKMVATADYLSGGRVALGVGVSQPNPVESEACGVRSEDRGRRANEALEVMMRLWSEPKATFEGKYYQLHDVAMEPKPVQQPHPPIWIGGASEAALRRAAKYGDGWMAFFVNPQGCQDRYQQIQVFAREAGRDGASIELGVELFTNVSNDRDEARRMVAQFHPIPADVLVDRYGLAGTPEECREKVQAYVDAGVRTFFLVPSCQPDQLMTQIETYAREIVPHFR